MNSQDKISNYLLKEKLGKGSYGQVFKVIEKCICIFLKFLATKKIFALKELNIKNLKKQEIEEIMKEAKLLNSLSHENIVKIEDSFEYDNSTKFGMILEYCDGGDLSAYLKHRRLKKSNLSENKIIYIFKQILDGLEYLHSKKIIHRDVKTLNIFLYKDGRVKIGDLGIAKVLLYNSCANTVIGTPLYLAPEICQQKPYNEKSDIWSLGCILYELITLALPFDAPNYVALCEKIMKGNYTPIGNDIKIKYSSDLIKLIEIILQRNPEKRPTVKEIKKYKLFEDTKNEGNLNNMNNNELKKINPVIKNENIKNEKHEKNEKGIAEIKPEKIQNNNKGFNYENMIKNKLENADKNFDQRKKKYFQNFFNKQNVQNENKVENNKVKLENNKKPIELKNIQNNNMYENNHEKYKQNDFIQKYNNILGNLKNILDESKLNFKPKENIPTKKSRDIKSAKDIIKHNPYKNEKLKIAQNKKISEKNIPCVQVKKNPNECIPNRVRPNPKGQQDILVKLLFINLVKTSSISKRKEERS